MAALRITRKAGAAISAVILIAAGMYSRYVDWPSFGGEGAIRAYLPETFPVSGAHHYTFTNFMDTWELYRFTTTPEAIDFLTGSLRMGDPAIVHEFPLIISPPPPYWWHPELLLEAQIFSTRGRAPDGRMYQLLYSADSGIAYLIKFDG